MFQANLSRTINNLDINAKNVASERVFHHFVAESHIVFTNSKFHQADSHIVATNEIFSQCA